MTKENCPTCKYYQPFFGELYNQFREVCIALGGHPEDDFYESCMEKIERIGVCDKDKALSLIKEWSKDKTDNDKIVMEKLSSGELSEDFGNKKNSFCEWELDGFWTGSCGITFELSNYDGLKENNIIFCPKCGKKLTSLEEKKGGSSSIRFSCVKCGYKKRVPKPPSIPKLIKRNPRECIAIITKKDQKIRTFPTIRVECPRCNNNKAYTWMVQVKELEKPTTQFFRCTKCTYTFREE